MPPPTNALALQCDGNRIITGIDYSSLETVCGISDPTDRDSKSTEEAHKHFMSSYQKMFLRPKKVIPRIPLPAHSKVPHVPVRARQGDSNASWDMSRRQSHGRLARDHLITHTLKALRKLPIERSQMEQQVIRRALGLFPCLMALLSRQELQQVSSITILETWEKGQTVFVCDGLHLVLRGTVKLQPQEASRNPSRIVTVTIGVGGYFGSLEEQEVGGASRVTQCAVAQDNCDILRIPCAAYAKLRQEIEAQSSTLRESVIQACPFYLHWPRLAIKKLSNLIQMRHLPTNHTLVREGEVCPFVAYVRMGQCNILQDIRVLGRKPPEKKGNRARYVVVGTLGPRESFGEISILLDQPSPCSIVTATEVKIGVILPDALRGLDPVTRSLMLQTAQPAHVKLSKEQVTKMYVAQERHKEWLHIKKRVLSDGLFYNGIKQENTRWSLSRGQRPAQVKYSQTTATLL